MDSNRWKQFINEAVKVYVHGYVKPESAFYTIAEWEQFANEILKFQKNNQSLRGGKIEGEKLERLIYYFYDFQFNVEVDRYELLTFKNVLHALKLYDHCPYSNLCF